jgi:flagellar protein FlgJ
MGNALPSSAAATALPAGIGDSLSFQGLNQLSARAQANPRDPATIRAVSQQFEALLVQRMLQSAEAVKFGPDLLGSTSGPLFQSMFTQQIASSVSQGSGIGLGSFLARELSARWGSQQTAGAAAPGGANAPGATVPAQAPVGARAAPSAAAPAPAQTAASNASAGPAQAAPVGDATAAAQARSFIASILPSARAAARALGVSPLGILAQAALETGWGRRAPGNNLFGIKASAGWHGASLSSITHEFDGGLRQVGQAAFRAYYSVAASVQDYTSLLESPRFAAVRGHGNDLGAFAQALQRAGYASDPGYAHKLLEVANGPTMREALGSLASAQVSSPALP